MSADPQMRWLRLWTDILEDPKLLLLSPGDRWYYIGILALKRTGLLDERDSTQLRDRKVALRLRLLSGCDAPVTGGVTGCDAKCDSEKCPCVNCVRERLREVRLIDKDWQPVGWEKRQFDSDTSASRTRKWRERNRHGDKPVTTKERHGDVAVTPSEQRQSRDRDRAEQNTQERVTPDVHAGDFRELQAAYPPGTYRQSDWLLAEREIRSRLEEGDTPREMLAGVERYRAQADAKGSTRTQFVLSPRRFFAERQYREPFPLPAQPKTATEELLANLNRPRVINHDV